MTFQTAAALALIFGAGAASAQSASPPVGAERVVVRIADKSPGALRAELMRASQAVCRGDAAYLTTPDETCVAATYSVALRRLSLARPTAFATVDRR